MTEPGHEVCVSVWSEVTAFQENGLNITFKSELDADDFSLFANLLRAYWEKPFQLAEERMEGDAQISVATPKPSELPFEKNCAECKSKIRNEEIHFEVIAEDEFLMICRDCFFRNVFEGE
jgi:hypothetical protein